MFSVGADLVDQVLTAKPWTANAGGANQARQQSDSWAQLKRGLCFFFAEYYSKSKAVEVILRKHLCPDKEDDEAKAAAKAAIAKEFCEDSPMLRNLLEKEAEEEKKAAEQAEEE